MARKIRMAGALGLVAVALVVTSLSVRWIWTKADAVTPVTLPAPNPTPMETLTPSVKPSFTPPPRGKVIGSNLVAVNGDTMPLMSSAWKDAGDQIGLVGGAGNFLTVHEDYDGAKDWGNYVVFGQLPRSIKYVNTPAGLRAAAASVGGRLLANVYPGENLKPYMVVHRPITLSGRKGHEITARVPIKQPGLKETFSYIVIVVIDRGDGTAAVSTGDIAGTTPQWVAVWRQRVAQIKINR